ncbi:metal-dependent hydrolase family protein [Natranaerobius trueperi]|uniref:Aryldialkylphosphatase n=1 Tax=Natranaerobius trueperi TaxID=759412 RepID=A0A226BWU7_9FIRM|nr:amidohydrolase family protein [Natranaerobius trueperi]OWZ83391.1 aryldialkylphosphatase [Natranaerobius trueperi]
MSKLLIKSVNIIDGDSNELQENMDVLIEGEKISKIKKTISDNEAKQIDGTKKYLVPGLIDTHVHLVWDGSGDPQSKIEKKDHTYLSLTALKQAKSCLYNGITTVRDVGSPGLTVLSLKQAINEQKAVGSNIICSGPAMVMIGGHGWFLGKEVSGEDEIRRKTREVLKEGVDLVKVMATGGIYTDGEEPGAPQLQAKEIEAAVIEAHNQGKKVASHAQGLTGIENSITAGVDSIEHCIFADDNSLQKMKEQDIFMVPTLNVMKRMANIGVAGGLPEFAAKKASQVVKVHQNTFQKALDKGVKIAAGTDLFAPYLPTKEYFNELKLMNELGMSPSQVLRSATSKAAELLDITNRGIIKEGNIADLVLLNNNPLSDIGALKDQYKVIKEGSLI